MTTMVVTPTTFRQILASFPAGVTVISSIDPNGAHVGITATAVASVSLDPPQLLVCINKRLYTLDAIQQTRQFAVNFLAANQRNIAMHFASKRRDKFLHVPWVPGEVTGAPIIEETLGYAECEVSAIHDGGDHAIVVGLLVGGRASDGPALTYFEGQFGVAGESVVAQHRGSI